MSGSGGAGGSDNTTFFLEGCVARLAAGDVRARDQLIHAACGRLEQLTRKMLRSFPGVKLWEQTADVFQNAVLRLYKALQEVRPGSVREFFGLAATQIRRELIDLARHHAMAAKRVNLVGGGGAGIPGGGADTAEVPVPGLNPADSLDGSPDRMALWTEFHRAAEALPDDEREVFGLLWYQGLAHEQAAKVLSVSSKTIQRRWMSARLKLHDALHGQMPE
jgi:RNA polymerase sigma-70 factor (ECF subfamily)